MARKSEVGIEYFPMNSDIVLNPKIKLVVAEFGSKLTWATLMPLYCKIYREKGYWLDWFDEDSKLLFSQDEAKLDLCDLDNVVGGCIRRSLFSKIVFDKFGVLTSDRIQENYLEAKKRSRNIILIKDFLLINQSVYETNENVTVIPVTAALIAKTVTVMPQKEKENKKEIIEGDCGIPLTPTEDEKRFIVFVDWIEANAKTVSELKEPFTFDQFMKLIESKISIEFIKELLLKMHNYEPLKKKSKSAYLTFLNWSKRENNNATYIPQAQPQQNTQFPYSQEEVRRKMLAAL